MSMQVLALAGVAGDEEEEDGTEREESSDDDDGDDDDDDDGVGRDGGDVEGSGDELVSVRVFSDAVGREARERFK
jgi:hypothetical protein